MEENVWKPYIIITANCQLTSICNHNCYKRQYRTLFSLPLRKIAFTWCGITIDQQCSSKPNQALIVPWDFFRSGSHFEWHVIHIGDTDSFTVTETRKTFNCLLSIGPANDRALLDVRASAGRVIPKVKSRIYVGPLLEGLTCQMLQFHQFCFSICTMF